MIDNDIDVSAFIWVKEFPNPFLKKNFNKPPNEDKSDVRTLVARGKRPGTEKVFNLNGVWFSSDEIQMDKELFKLYEQELDEIEYINKNVSIEAISRKDMDYEKRGC